MNTLILGGDKRYYEIIEAFKNKKYNIDLVGYKNKIDKTNNLNISDVDVSKYDIILFPVNAIGEDYTINGEINFKINPDFLKQAKDNVLIFSGIKTPKLDEILKNGEKKAFFLMKDKESFIKGEEQQFVRSIFHNGNNFLIFGGRIMFEGTRYRIKPVDTSPISSHPDYSVTILKETINSLVA